MGSEKDFLGHVADLQKMIEKRRGTIGVEVSHKSETHVTERRAPTDESVRLLDEMQKAAEDRLVFVMSCNSTAFSFTAHLFTDPARMFQQRMRVRFCLGDRNYDLNVEIDLDHARSKHEYIKVVHELLVKAISGQILESSFSDLVKHKAF